MSKYKYLLKIAGQRYLLKNDTGVITLMKVMAGAVPVDRDYGRDRTTYKLPDKNAPLHDHYREVELKLLPPDVRIVDPSERISTHPIDADYEEIPSDAKHLNGTPKLGLPDKK